MTQTIEVLEPLSADAEHHHRIWRSVNIVKRLSDRIVGWGPFGLGMDGLLTWIPGAGEIFTVGAGAYLIVQAFRAGASTPTIVRMALYLVADATVTAVPLIGDLMDTFFRGHAMAATALQKDIESRHGAPPEVPPKHRTLKRKVRA